MDPIHDNWIAKIIYLQNASLPLFICKYTILFFVNIAVVTITKIGVIKCCWAVGIKSMCTLLQGTKQQPGSTLWRCFFCNNSELWNDPGLEGRKDGSSTEWGLCIAFSREMLECWNEKLEFRVLVEDSVEFLESAGTLEYTEEELDWSNDS